jgi:putative restriction endonuclease
MATKAKDDLLQCLLDGIEASDWKCIVSATQQPFGLTLFQGEELPVRIRAYIWNCTPGGNHRPSDEFRIQFTGATPKTHPGEITLLLGWHDGYKVFVGWSVIHHRHQAGKSPSAQVKEETLGGAHTKTFAVQVKKNDQVVVAFQPQFLVEYALAAKRLHGAGVVKSELLPLDDLSKVDQATIDSIGNPSRRVVVAQIARRYRAFDFRRRVLGAYRHRCAFCGVQLQLLDAAHILPVASPASTDATSNGIALCKLHHAAFDGNLVSFNQQYKIEVSAHQLNQLRAQAHSGGVRQFSAMLNARILLPSDGRERPVPAQIVCARAVRGWKP